jgi:uncharacterized protein (TIGR00251 family)
VSPGASQTTLVGRHGDGWKFRIAAPPEQGKANDELCAFIATVLGVPKRTVTVVAGASGRDKVVQIDDLTFDQVENALELRPMPE